MGYSVYDLDPVDANNTSVSGISQEENVMTPSSVNNAFRAIDGNIARFVDDLGGVNTVGGTADAITVTLASGITAYATGQRFVFKAGSANTGAATMNVNAIGAKAIRRKGDSALSAGDLAANGRYEVIYDAAYNGAAGAWVLMNPEGGGSSFSTDVTITSTDAGATAGPALTLYRNSATPAASDLIGNLVLSGEDSAGNTQTYADVVGRVDDATSTSEDGSLLLRAVLAGTLTTHTIVGAGAVSPGSSDGQSLGTTSLMWSDLFLASGAVVNFNNGNATLTHSAGLLTSNVPISLGTSNALTAGSIEVGHASDTTITRVSAGNIAVEGNALYRAGGTDVAVADGGTGASTLTLNNVILGNGTSAVQFVAPGASGNLLTSDGTTWTSSAAASSGQPIPTNATYAVGTLAILQNKTGGSITAGSTASGASLQAFSQNTTPSWTTGGAQTGTWTNVNGVAVATNGGGYFVRTA